MGGGGWANGCCQDGRVVRGCAKDVSGVFLQGGSGFVATSLHQQLKQQYVADEGRHEQTLAGYRIDAIDGRGRLIEVQCASLSAIRDKIRVLVEEHDVIVVKPLVARRQLVTLNPVDLAPVRSRYSPLQQTVAHVFQELVHFSVFPHPRLQLDVVLTEQQELRLPPTERTSWRRKYSVHDRVLVSVVRRIRLKTAADLWRALEVDLPGAFTTAELAAACGMPRWLAQKAAWCFRRMGHVEVCGKRGNSIEYRLKRSVRGRRRAG